MSKPPHTGITNLSQNPPEPNDRRRRSRKEEERRLKAIRAHAKRAAAKLPPELAGLLRINDLPGEIAPDAEDSTLGQKVEASTTPKLVDLNHRQAGRVEIGEMKLPDGTTLKNVKVIGPSSTKLTASLQELTELAKKLADIVGDVKDSVVGLCVRVVNAVTVLVAGRDGDSIAVAGESPDGHDLADEANSDEEFDDRDDNGYPTDDSDD
jgi:hypothetical protein